MWGAMVGKECRGYRGRQGVWGGTVVGEECRRCHGRRGVQGGAMVGEECRGCGVEWHGAWWDEGV